MRTRRSIFALLFVLFWADTVVAQPKVHGPVDEGDLLQYARWLRLSDEQAHAMRFMHQRYLEEWSFRADQRRDCIEARNAVINAYGNPPRSLEAFERRIEEKEDLLTIARKSYRCADTLRTEYEVLDEDFFADLERILTTQQAERISRVRNGRQRRIHAPTESGLPEGSFDMIAWFERPQVGDQMQQPSGELLDMSADEYQAIERVISEFENLCVAALHRYWDNYRRSVQPRYSLIQISRYVSLGQFTAETAPDLYDEMRRHRKSVARHMLEAARVLEQANRQGLTEFMNNLPDDLAAELQQFYLEHAYPEVYPDRSSADTLYEEILAFADLTDKQRDAIRVLHAEFQRRHGVLSRRMSEVVRDRHLARLGDESIAGGVQQAWEDLRKFGDQRLELSESQADLLHQMLRPEQIKRMTVWDFTKHPQPKPWDPHWRDPQHRPQRPSRQSDGGTSGI